MIKQIINWTAGGFFRTLGKFILFGLIALILGYFMSQRNIHLPFISFGKVYASTTESFSSAESRLYLDQAGTEAYTSWHTVPYTQSVSYPVTQMQYRLKATDGFYADNTYRFKISYQPSPDSLNVTGIWFSDGTNTLTDVMCSGWARTSTGYYETICTISPEIDISSSNYLYARLVFNASYVNSVRSYVSAFEESKGVTSAINDQTIEIVNNQNENTTNIIDNQNENTQAIINSNKSFIVIDNNNISINGKYLESSGNQATSSAFGITSYIKISSSDTLTILKQDLRWLGASSCFYDVNKIKISCFVNKDYTDNSTITIPANSFYVRFSLHKNDNIPIFNICKNGSQATLDILENVDTTDSSNALVDFLNNITLGTEGVMGQILTLPIDIITTMLEPDNTNLCFTLKGKQVCFPSGSIIWNRSGCTTEGSWFGCPDFSAFRTFFQLVGEGLIVWFLLRMIVHTIERCLDPVNMKEVVMKL